MIPYELKIKGIRDYSPRSISLGEPDEHILVTGPNGVGKSTLTFCLGAVLNSSKVEIGGLRSTNLKENEPWSARIILTFLNEGPTKVDGPRFIAFQLTTYQEVKNSPIKKEYEVLQGEQIDNLEVQARYVSGGGLGRNYEAYEEALKIRYKVEPDQYYLIWYQQEVNQFAAMHPEERFRKFSDMFGITGMQQEWESSLESIKETNLEITHFKAVQKSAELELGIAQKVLNHFLETQNQIERYGSRYRLLLQELINYSEQSAANAMEQKSIKALEKDQTQIALEEVKKVLQQLDERIEQIDESLLKLQQKQQNQQELYELTYNQRKQLRIKKKELKKQLEVVDEKRKKLIDDEPTTRRKLQIVAEQLQQNQKQFEQFKKDQSELNIQTNHLEQEKMKRVIELDQLQEQLDKAQQLKNLYGSSATVEKKQKQLEKQMQEDFEQIERLKKEKLHLQERIQSLQKKKVISKRQQQGLTDLKKKGIVAYPLRELIELIPTASLKMETQLDAMKYTIFYVGKDYKPQNDLYYVSLPQLIPTESISKLESHGLQIRHDLTDEESNYANKALWWVNQFFKGEPKLEQGLLFDIRGVRGSQETSEYILSDIAIENLRMEVEEQYHVLMDTLQKLEQQQIQNQEKQYRYIDQIQAMKKAEAILTNRSIIVDLQKQIEYDEKRLSDWYDELNVRENQIEKLRQEISNDQVLEQQLEKQCRIYDELGAFAEQQSQLQQLDRQEKEMNHTLQKYEEVLEDYDEQIRNSKRKREYEKDQKLEKEQELRERESQFTTIIDTLKQLDEKIELEHISIQQYQKEKVDLEKILPEAAFKLETVLEKKDNHVWLKEQLVGVRMEFNKVRQEEVNENAQQNYDVQKKEYDRKAAELANAEGLLEKYTTRANETEERLETTISMFLNKINALFETYMDYFHFEGHIEKKRIEDTRGRIKFLLYIKARKHGHKSTLEDVSEKARNGKVGKGVSGGEESLSSLLFALALLRNLSISPGYIVLDEFDSALDDERKNKVFELYAEELQRKLIIVSPKGHDETYYNHFSKVYIVEHDPSIPKSTIRGIQNKK